MNRPLFIQWHERNDIGINLIDEQHKGIVSIINSFYYLMGLKTGNKLLYSCISDTMKNYSRIHFITEEGFLEAVGYKDLEEHKKLHRDLTQEIDRIEYQGIRTNDARPLLEFLKKWWIEHINEQDQLYAQYLRTHDPVVRPRP
ncbi:MAG: bacteriohemerythrin [Deltaproteobacteria bacterium]|jgi:hemerythrin|nr:bacteriohemerythrin [Deltaproteobacteria bacterium]